jgi:membrane protease YdiL (CAAX protease family)
MDQRKADQVPVLVVLLFVLAALLIRSRVESLLVLDGVSRGVAADLSYLVVPVCLAALLWPLLRHRPHLLKRLFRCDAVNLRTCAYAIIVGALLRLVYWAELVAGVSIGTYSDVDAPMMLRPVFSFACPELPVLLLGFFVMSLVVPLVEEFVHRGLIQSSLARRGPLLAIGMSSLLFAAFHRPASWGYVLFAGLVFGALFWKTRTIWLPAIAHATTNGAAQIDWGCLRGRWNPPIEVLPLWPIAAMALLVLVLSTAGLVFILCKKIPGGKVPPGGERITERVQPVQ